MLPNSSFGGATTDAASILHRREPTEKDMLMKRKSSLIFTTLLLVLAGCSSPSETGEDMSSQKDDMAGAVTDMSSDQDMAAQTPDQGDSPDMTDDDMASPPEDMGPDGMDMPDAALDMEQEDMNVEPPTEPTRLRLATWNIFYLDTPEEADESGRVASDYERLAGYVDALGADVVALQEIHGVEGARTLFPEDAWEVQCEERNSRQNVCIALANDAGWNIERHPDVESLQAGNPNLRKGLDVTLSKPGYDSLRMLVVHMKADCYYGNELGGCATFFTQITALEEWIDARAEEDTPYMVIGDFNRFMTEDDEAWLEIDDAMPARADLSRSIAPGNTPCWNGMFSEFIDHIFLEPNNLPWLVDSAQLVFQETDFEAEYKKLSDHCPLWVDLDVPPAQQ
jgi:endonuclease/exonuclease/phosphatase family metal-dependent hydrolase/outer membrane murein-binding lipoprotein Lpp